MSTLYMVWLATDDQGQTTTRRTLFTATVDRMRAIQAASNVNGTLTFTTEWTPEEFESQTPDIL